ncbi:hypothetical protein [Enteractinococcus coprophilus]|uniref:Uncharacterized protein n=1 Tax=Enteractinococcus coprophilus TaxID=1027633 RepID=A0A543AFJ8_9MICC|nr:hypothetical protein [Enteractinococcus coprophilus]TQL71342.1 hypothetical protein FB556_1817 [Enteractinococcus coprophilus]
MRKAAGTKPRQAKNFGIAFFFLSLLMVAVQLINYIITLLPAAEGAVIDLGDGTTIPVSSLSSSYLTLVIITLVVYGGTWFGVLRSMNWARWIAVVLAVLAAVLAVQSFAQVVATGFSDVVGLAMSLAQLIAAGWVLALAFRREVYEWYTKKNGPQAPS